MGHPDFRVGGKIFATLGPGEAWGMVSLTPEQQAAFVQSAPGMFEVFDNAWGRQGATKVILRSARKTTIRPALIAAWRNRAPKRLHQKLED